ncbi:hypothetical protein [Gluconobacter oxydans]|uniref:Pentapeptide MXKDX repeat protein n=2 Tax=Gluconobacter oxydans TaxID=442 RepID=Q5FT48_GLUOX|nr:hypothetical protein [Gluconobacter oxydans]AAW60448.1 Hypothetical protein GOX0671 [Gluconobacter oxydans 621H]MBF0857164.1 hypothetical protein [Gluconobacter oxydans]TCW23068.1 hypothetical protein EDC20_12816 [Gluconobacter oxydans]GEC61725.1 hypothetical protein GOX01_20560 [Gluconobacter oxydans]
MRKTFLALTVLLATGMAHAADPSMPGMDMSHMDMSGGTMSMPSSSTQNPLAGLSMDQQMVLCSHLQTLSRQRSTLTPKMKQQLAACQKMDMGMSNQPAPGETLDR